MTLSERVNRQSITSLRLGETDSCDSSSLSLGYERVRNRLRHHRYGMYSSKRKILPYDGVSTISLTMYVTYSVTLI